MQSQYASLPNLYITLNKSNLHYNSHSTNYPLQEETGPGGNTDFASTDCDSCFVQSTWSSPHSSGWREVYSPNTRQPAAVLKKDEFLLVKFKTWIMLKLCLKFKDKHTKVAFLVMEPGTTMLLASRRIDVSCEGAKWASVITFLTLLFIVSIWDLILLPS